MAAIALYTRTAIVAGDLPVDELAPQAIDILVKERNSGSSSGTHLQGPPRGFDGAQALDAMIKKHTGMHDHGIAHVVPRLGETGTNARILTRRADRG